MTSIYHSVNMNAKWYNPPPVKFAPHVFLIFDKALLPMDGSIGGLFLLVNGYLDRKAGPAMREEKGGVVAAIF